MDKKVFLKQIDEMIFYLDDVTGGKLYRELSAEDKRIIDKDEELRGAFLALRFLIIPFLSTREIADLLTEHLTAGLMIEEIDLDERIRKKLIFSDLSDRDNCKNALKKALLENEEIITDETEVSGKKIKTTADWLKDYLSQVGLKKAGSLERAKYFSEKNYVFNLNEDDKKILRKIIDLYKFLNTSSLTPEGFEDDLILKDKDNRVLTTNKGKIVVLYDPKKNIKPAATNFSADKPVIKVPGENNYNGANDMAELKNLAAGYPAGSLERKAVEEEIKKLEL